jgi:DNA polymerase III delta prime subunit
MQLPDKIERWVSAGVVPQRLLLTGREDSWDIALEIAARIQGASINQLKAGLHADTLVLSDEGTFKIGDDKTTDAKTIRGMIRWAHQKPTAPWRIVVFENFERTFHAAVHATLKLLEEPPTRTLFIMTTENPYRLLDTVLSRVTLVRLPHEDKDFELNDDIQQFLKGSDLLAKFEQIETLDKETRGGEKIDRTPIIEWLDKCIAHARSLRNLRHTLELLLDARNAIEGNMNIRFTLERLALHLMKK